MSEWAWRNCPDCGRRTHINNYCSKCGGDPWGIEETALKEIRFARERIIGLERETTGWENVIEKHRKNLSPRGDNRDTMQSIKQVYVNLKEHVDLQMPTSSSMRHIREHLEIMIRGDGVKVTCDESNNPPSVIDDNDIIARVYWYDERMQTKYIDLHFGKVMHFRES